MNNPVGLYSDYLKIELDIKNDITSFETAKLFEFFFSMSFKRDNWNNIFKLGEEYDNLPIQIKRHTILKYDGRDRLRRIIEENKKKGFFSRLFGKVEDYE